MDRNIKLKNYLLKSNDNINKIYRNFLIKLNELKAQQKKIYFKYVNKFEKNKIVEIREKLK